MEPRLGKGYTFQIRAVNANGNGAASDEKTALLNGICDRTDEVEKAILDAINDPPGTTPPISPQKTCDEVTYTDITNFETNKNPQYTVKGLYIGNLDIGSLKTIDFYGLKKVGRLDVDNNDLTALPANVFDGLTLTTLVLAFNDIATLPAGTFAGARIEHLDLRENELTRLPETLFQGTINSTLKKLRFFNNRISGLPQNIFKGLTKTRGPRLRGQPADGPAARPVQGPVQPREDEFHEQRHIRAALRHLQTPHGACGTQPEQQPPLVPAVHSQRSRPVSGYRQDTRELSALPARHAGIAVGNRHPRGALGGLGPRRPSNRGAGRARNLYRAVARGQRRDLERENPAREYDRPHHLLPHQRHGLPGTGTGGQLPGREFLDIARHRESGPERNDPDLPQAVRSRRAGVWSTRSSSTCARPPT